VYDLDYKKFGMSAKFTYPEALKDLGKIFDDAGGDK
ncbi:MAG: heme ABC transporter substrate-binding protein IsdE, partial [Peptostreptococcus sp.]|nr:heme ABC transporter substrate-binding protein IsdE [Peptostreptococcus sp.]